MVITASGKLEAKSADSSKTADDFVDEMIKEPSLDRFFDIHPERLTDDDFRQFIAQQRRERARFIEKDSK